MCIDSVKETYFSQKYQKWIYQVLEMSSSSTETFILLYFLFGLLEGDGISGKLAECEETVFKFTEN